MAAHSRFEWSERIKKVEREFLAAQQAGTVFLDQVQRDPTILLGDVRMRDVRAMVEFLEGTYLIRLFAAFEAGLRTYWETIRGTPARMRDLIDSIAAQRGVPDDLRDSVHVVREYRNSLVHEAGETTEEVALGIARSRLLTFFSRLPERW